MACGRNLFTNENPIFASVLNGEQVLHLAYVLRELFRHPHFEDYRMDVEQTEFVFDMLAQHEPLKNASMILVGCCPDVGGW